MERILPPLYDNDPRYGNMRDLLVKGLFRPRRHAKKLPVPHIFVLTFSAPDPPPAPPRRAREGGRGLGGPGDVGLELPRPGNSLAA